MKNINWKNKKELYCLINVVENHEQERIGKEFKKWFHSKEKEDVEDAIFRITSVRV